MGSFAEQLAALSEAGYRVAEAQAKVAHDAILLAMYKSGFKNHSTVKGGVVMCELTKEVRRTTMAMATRTTRTKDVFDLYYFLTVTSSRLAA